MLCSVSIYQNTGLTPGNVYKTFSSTAAATISGVALKQVWDLVNIRLSVSSTVAQSVDFLMISYGNYNYCYYVTAYTMANDNVCIFSLQEAALQTALINGSLVSIGGTVIRKSPDPGENTIFSNTLDEPFSPKEPLAIDIGSQIGETSPTYSKSIAISTVDLAKTDELEAIAFYVPETDKKDGVAVPQLPTVNKLNRTQFFLNTSGIKPGGLTENTEIPGCAAFDENNDTIIKGMQKVRSIGVESAIKYSYSVPTSYVGSITVDSDGTISSVTGTNTTYKSSFGTTTPYTASNKKVYSGQFTKICLASISTGDISEFKPEDIQQSNAITWRVFSDPAPWGRPVALPAYFHGSSNYGLIGSVNGFGWQNSSLEFLAPSGYLRSMSAINLQERQNSRSSAILGVYNTGLNLMKDTITGGLETSSPASSIQGLMSSQISNALNAKNQTEGLMQNIAQAEPDLKFPLVPGLQCYLGNYFIEYRYRLSVSDAERFDRFLTCFGWRVYEPFKSSDLTVTQKYFRFIQTEAATVKTSGAFANMHGRIEEELNAGVRIWKTAITDVSSITNY